MSIPDFLRLRQGQSRLILSIPHAGTDLPTDCAPLFVSPWQARADADWWLEKLYDFAEELDATILRTTVSRSIIDVNRDPSGRSLYPGMATTGLCPETDFDGRPLYREGGVPDAAAIAERRTRYFDPYHAALAAEIERLRMLHGNIVLFDAHSIRSRIPRLFEGVLPVCNIGTNAGISAHPALGSAFEARIAASPFDHVRDGRFKGGWITRHYGAPAQGVHAIQLELACRAYIDEPEGPIDPDNWPTPYAAPRARDIRAVLRDLFATCLTLSLS